MKTYNSKNELLEIVNKIHSLLNGNGDMDVVTRFGEIGSLVNDAYFMALDCIDEGVNVNGALIENALSNENVKETTDNQEETKEDNQEENPVKEETIVNENPVKEENPVNDETVVETKETKKATKKATKKTTKKAKETVTTGNKSFQDMNIKELRAWIKDHGYTSKARSKKELLEKLELEMKSAIFGTTKEETTKPVKARKKATKKDAA